MKRTKTVMAAIAITSAAIIGCNNNDNQQTTDAAEIIGKSSIKIVNNRLTPEALWAMGRIGSISVSPNANNIVYGVSYYSVQQNKSHHTLHLMQSDGNGQTQLTTTAYNESNATWIKNGSKIAFLSNASGSNQIWEMNPDGTGRKQLSNSEKDIEGFLFSPDEKSVIIIQQIPIKQTTAEKHPDLPLSQGIIVDDLMYKHWDQWLTTAPHPFIAKFDGEKISIEKDILENTLYDCPNRPFGGIEQLAWSKDSKKIAYACVKKMGVEYTLSTDTDIYLYNTEDETTINLCKLNEATANYGYDTTPSFSPDGTHLAWLSMKRDGYESDQNRLCIMNLINGEQKYISEKAFDSNVENYCWAADGKSLYFTGVWHGTTMIYNIDLNGILTQITNGEYDYTSVAILGNKLITTRQSISEPTDIYTVETTSQGEIKQLTYENKHILDQLQRGKVEARWCKSNDGKQILSWIIYPPQFDPNKKYPTLLFCQGGPQSPVSQFWSYRWNFQLMAANDYIVIAPNRRGLPGFGMEWNEAISGDYGGLCMQDLFAAIDDFSKESYVDKNRLGCVGASFGGYTAMWMAGHHEKRFKAFIAHDGFFNMEQQYYETEESWFANWDLGGAPYENKEKVRKSFSNSPHLFVEKWDTPILLIHGERDYRILASQSMAAFNAAKLRGIPAQLLIFPDENHWVLKPQNGILWQRTFFGWLDKWVKQ